MEKTILLVLAVWILVCAGLIGLFLIIPEGKIRVSADRIIVYDDGTPAVDCNYTRIQDSIDYSNTSDTIRV